MNRSINKKLKEVIDMCSIIDVASYIVEKQKQLTGEHISEKKLHKLLYFTQRETLAILGQPAFKEPMEGWAQGPVSVEVREWYKNGGSKSRVHPISKDNQYIINNVLEGYGKLGDMKLVYMTHQEISWINSRAGLGKKENGHKDLDINDIRKDSERIRPYDYVWGMYYDEFEDCEAEDGVVYA